MELACKDNLGMLWLTALLAPDHNTLWGFFLRNRQSLRRLFQCSVQVALDVNLMASAVHALDGTNVQAAVANAPGWHRTRLEERLAQLTEEIAEIEERLVQSRAVGETAADCGTGVRLDQAAIGISSAHRLPTRRGPHRMGADRDRLQSPSPVPLVARR